MGLYFGLVLGWLVVLGVCRLWWGIGLGDEVFVVLLESMLGFVRYFGVGCVGLCFCFLSLLGMVMGFCLMVWSQIWIHSHCFGLGLLV